jgi:hypothetical protein
MNSQPHCMVLFVIAERNCLIPTGSQPNSASCRLSVAILSDLARAGVSTSMMPSLAIDGPNEKLQQVDWLPV